MKVNEPANPLAEEKVGKRALNKTEEQPIIVKAMSVEEKEGKEEESTGRGRQRGRDRPCTMGRVR